MKMAIAIQCHTNSSQINKMIDFFDDEAFDLFLHIDKKSKIKKEIKINDNVHILDKSIDVKWGQYSQVLATLELFKNIKMRKEKYKYVHFISGQDYPIKSLNEFKEFFYNNNNEYINYTELPCEGLVRRGKDRYEVYYKDWMIDRPKKIFKRCIRVIYREFVLRSKFLKRKTDFIEKFYYGSQWFSITGKCMEYILEYLSENKEYEKFFRNSIYPDEMFFQTIILNSKFSYSVKNQNLRYIDWSEGKESPKSLKIDDIKNARKQNVFFARKIDDLEVVEWINSQFIDK